MMTPIVLLSTQMWNIEMRSSKLIIKSNAQKQMARFGFGRKYHDLNYFELEFFTFLGFIIHYILNVNFYHVLINFLTINFFGNITTCTVF